MLGQHKRDNTEPSTPHRGFVNCTVDFFSDYASIYIFA